MPTQTQPLNAIKRQQQWAIDMRGYEGAYTMFASNLCVFILDQACVVWEKLADGTYTRVVYYSVDDTVVCASYYAAK